SSATSTPTGSGPRKRPAACGRPAWWAPPRPWWPSWPPWWSTSSLAGWGGNGAALSTGPPCTGPAPYGISGPLVAPWLRPQLHATIPGQATRRSREARPVRAYLDHSATTPPDPQVVRAMTEAMGAEGFGNPSSLHTLGH